MRENELEQRQMEMAKILAFLNKQEQELNNIIQSRLRNTQEMDILYEQSTLDIHQLEAHRQYDIKLGVDIVNQQRKIDNTKMLLKRKQMEVAEAHKKVEILKKLKEKQEEKYYKDFLDAEIKEIDDITSARFNIK